MGPILIFDKSVLHSLNPDEAVWLDQFFLNNITPIFFVETLADLEKEVGAGRTPEQVVGNLAHKTPDLESVPNVHHSSLIAGELSGREKIDMRYGRPIVPGGQRVELDGKVGVVFQAPPEAEALDRWQRGEFLDLERQIAKSWRRALLNINFEEVYKSFHQSLLVNEKPKTLAEAKGIVDKIISMPNQEQLLLLGLMLLGVNYQAQRQIMWRWQAAGRPPIREFAPYFAHVLTVDLLFYIGIGADLIGRERASHKIDIAYLYYLPFCMVFTSNDRLHANMAPLLLKSHQSFVNGTELKKDLARLDQFFSALPKEVRRQGLYHFATYPPPDSSYLVTQLWDKHMSRTWRESEAKPREPVGEKADPDLLKELGRLEKEGMPLDPSKFVEPDEVNSMLMKRKVRARKGKWMRFPPEVIEAERNKK